MSSIIGRAASRATPRFLNARINAGKNTEPIYKKFSQSAQSSEDAGSRALRQGAKRDPELFVRPRYPAFRYLHNAEQY